MTELTPHEREVIIRQLREEAIAECRKLGCTCEPEPEMSLTPFGIGPHNLPAWMSDHSDDCGISKRVSDSSSSSDVSGR